MHWYSEYAVLCIITSPEAASLFRGEDPLNYTVFPPACYSAYQTSLVSNAESADLEISFFLGTFNRVKVGREKNATLALSNPSMLSKMVKL